jgi:uncharacterized protein YciI
MAIATEEETRLMLFAVIGLFKPGADPIPAEVQLKATDYLGQPVIDIRAVGQLHDEDGKHAGMMLLLEVEDFAAAKRFTAESPFRQAGLYEDFRIFEYALEVGNI